MVVKKQDISNGVMLVIPIVAALGVGISTSRVDMAIIGSSLLRLTPMGIKRTSQIHLMQHVDMQTLSPRLLIAMTCVIAVDQN